MNFPDYLVKMIKHNLVKKLFKIVKILKNSTSFENPRYNSDSNLLWIIQVKLIFLKINECKNSPKTTLMMSYLFIM